MDLTMLSIDKARKLIVAGEISCVELTQAYLERIARFDPLLNCFITPTPEVALEQARQADIKIVEIGSKDEKAYPPLLGIPIALKDLYETAKIRTTAGSLFYKDYFPAQDATVVKKLTRAGAIVLGKLNMHEIALGVTNVNPHFGACRNPWNPQRITGGSSGGSGAALIAGLCLGSMGTDSGGSIRIPSSLCGVVGVKPTFGRVSLKGVIPLSWSTDHAGPMARSVADVARLLQIVSGYDQGDPFSMQKKRPNLLTNLADGVANWRIGLASGEFFAPSDVQVTEAINQATLLFEDLGGRVEQIELPGLYQAAQANALVVTSDAATFHSEHLQNHPELFGDDVLSRLRSGANATSTEYILARHTQVLLRRQFEDFFSKYDLLVLPTTPVIAPFIEGPDAVEQARRLTRYTAPFNLTGLPAISLPCGFSKEGLPIGLQIVTRPWAEAKLLRAAYTYEQATVWHEVRPSLE